MGYAPRTLIPRVSSVTCIPARNRYAMRTLPGYALCLSYALTRRVVSIVIPTRENANFLRRDLIDQPMFLINPS